MSQAVMNGLLAVLDIVLNMLQLVIIASALISWIGGDPSNPIVRAIREMTEPMYRALRPLTRKLSSTIDFAPFVILLFIVFMQRGIIPYLRLKAMG